MSTLIVFFTNRSHLHDSAVHLGFVPGASGDAVSLTNLKDQSPLLAVDGTGGTYPAPGNWYPLDQLSAGVGIRSFSGRIYVCYGQPWSVQNKGYEPAQAVTDPNFFLRYDKMELTYTGAPSDAANLTSIDYWSIPLSLTTLRDREAVRTIRGLRHGVTAQGVCDALGAITTPPASGLPGPGGIDGSALPALVPGRFQQYPGGPAPGVSFARIIGPSSYPPSFPAPGGIPVTPYDLLADYLRHLLEEFGPGTPVGDTVPTLGDGVIAHLIGEFAGVGPNLPPSGPQSRQTYSLEARIDKERNITLTGTASGVPGITTLLYRRDDLLNPAGIYGCNAPYHLNGASTPTASGNDVFGWIGGDLLSGLNLGAVGSAATYRDRTVGALPSQEWFKLPWDLFFASLQPHNPYYNQWAATLSKLSEAYNFAYSDRVAHVLLSLDPATVDTLEITLEDGRVAIPA